MNLLNKINKKAFYILLISTAVFMIMNIADAIHTFATLDALVEESVAMFEAAGANMESFVRGIFIVSGVIGLSLGLAYHALMGYFLLSHNKKPRQGRYLIVMMVLSILGALGNLIMIFLAASSFNLVGHIIGMLFSIAVVVGVIIHRNNPAPSITHQGDFMPPHNNPYDNPFQ